MPERLTASKGEVHTTVHEVARRVEHVIVGKNDVRGAESLGCLQLGRGTVERDDPGGAGEDCTLHGPWLPSIW